MNCLYRKEGKRLIIYPEDLVKNEYKREVNRLRIAKRFAELKHFSSEKEKEKHIRNVEKYANENIKDTENILNSTEIPEGEFNKIEIPSYFLADKKFLNKHKDILTNKHIVVVLNKHMDDYRSYRLEKFDRDKVLRIHYGENYSKDSNIGLQKQDLEKREEDLIEFVKNFKFKSIKFKENAGSEIEYSFNELETARKKISQVAKVINAYKNLSPYEKFYVAFSYVANYEWKAAEKDAPDEVSRSLLSILNGDKIVCAGKANLLKAICDEIGIPCVYRGCAGHAVCTVAINDPKYSIFGIEMCDPTNSNDGKPVLFNEKNNINRNMFAVNWIAKLNKKEKDFLMNESGLSKVPEEFLEASALEFKERDEKIKEIPVDYVFSEEEEFRFLESLYAVEAKYLKDIKNFLEDKNNNPDFRKVSSVIHESCYDAWHKSFDRGIVGYLFEKKYVNLSESFDNLGHIKSVLADLNNGWKTLDFETEFLRKNNVKIETKEVEKFMEEYKNQTYKEFDDLINGLEEEKDKKTKDINLIDKTVVKVEDKIENLADSLRQMSEFHAKGDEESVKAIFIGAQIDGAKTTNYNESIKKQQEEYWKQVARDMGLNPREILPTAKERNFSKENYIE